MPTSSRSETASEAGYSVTSVRRIPPSHIGHKTSEASERHVRSARGPGRSASRQKQPGAGRVRDRAFCFDVQASHLPDVDLPAVVAPYNVAVAIAVEVAGAWMCQSGVTG